MMIKSIEIKIRHHTNYGTECIDVDVKIDDEHSREHSTYFNDVNDGDEEPYNSLLAAVDHAQTVLTAWRTEIEAEKQAHIDEMEG